MVVATIYELNKVKFEIARYDDDHYTTKKKGVVSKTTVELQQTSLSFVIIQI